MRQQPRTLVRSSTTSINDRLERRQLARCRHHAVGGAFLLLLSHLDINSSAAERLITVALSIALGATVAALLFRDRILAFHSLGLANWAENGRLF
jgi:hypothetical protein